MCGIVGVLGSGPVAGKIINALKHLEYRGYDSAGIATLESGRLERRRAEGKIKNLEAKLSDHPLSGAIGIGHTRWATHGRPSERNAHPHASRRLAVVHNGIIENFRRGYQWRVASNLSRRWRRSAAIWRSHEVVVATDDLAA
jgi:glucosamine--fructose-6-phosphate aminotransferase (isomerizing)